MTNAVSVDKKKCIGCRLCEYACSFGHYQFFGPSWARISISGDEAKGSFSPIVCKHCKEPKCAQVCAFNALEKDSDNGQVKLDEEECIGCELCITACPFGALKFTNDQVLICELCGGDPECVKICPNDALAYNQNVK